MEKTGTKVTIAYRDGGGYSLINPLPLDLILEHIRAAIAAWPAALAELGEQPGELVEVAPGRWRWALRHGHAATFEEVEANSEDRDHYERFIKYRVDAADVGDFMRRYYKTARYTGRNHETPGYSAMLDTSNIEDVATQGFCIISHHDSKTGEAVTFYPYHLRPLTDEEQYDLPIEGWENPKVDTRRYYVTFSKAWETGRAMYEYLRAAGCLCQVVKGRYIVTNG